MMLTIEGYEVCLPMHHDAYIELYASQRHVEMLGRQFRCVGVVHKLTNPGPWLIVTFCEVI